MIVHFLLYQPYKSLGKNDGVHYNWQCIQWYTTEWHDNPSNKYQCHIQYFRFRVDPRQNICLVSFLSKQWNGTWAWKKYLHAYNTKVKVKQKVNRWRGGQCSDARVIIFSSLITLNFSLNEHYIDNNWSQIHYFHTNDIVTYFLQI